MPFRAMFSCLWCGRAHTVRDASDLEGWAHLCPDCVGKAGDNDFLRFRLKAALAERARATTKATRASVPAAPAPAAPARPLHDEMLAYYIARAPEYDDFYLRRGRYERGPIHDLAWQADLEHASQWLLEQPIGGEIVELAAGTGWWTPLLAQKGEVWAYDAAEATLDRARDRLLAHNLRAHLHVADAWSEPDRLVDAVFAGFWLSHVARADLAAFLALVRRWLKPGGTFLFIDSRRDPQSGSVDNVRPDVESDVQLRTLADGRQFQVVKVYYAPEELEVALQVAGFAKPRVDQTSRFFLLGRAVAA